MKLFRFIAINFICCLIVCASIDFNQFKLKPTNLSEASISLINHSAKILCNFNASAIYVYFENYTSTGYPASILRKFSDCGCSYIVLRNKYKTQPLKAIDDGIVMYLVLMIKNASQQIDLSIVKKKSATKHRSYFIVIVENSIDLNRKWLYQSFKKFWDIWILNAVIFFWRNNTINMYTFSPFTSKFLWKINSNAAGKNDLFFRKTPDMNGRKLRICLFPDETRAIFEPEGKVLGADGFMSSFVAGSLNATRVIKMPQNFKWSNVYASEGNNSADFCLSEMQTAKSDMALNTRFLSLDNFKRTVEHTVVYGRDDLCVLVPKAQPASLFWNLFRPFQIPVWAVIFLMFFLTYGFCRVLLPQTSHVCLKLYSTMLTQPLNEHNLTVSMRVFLVFWFSYCLLITASYKCNLMSNLVFRIALPEIDNLRELANSPYELLIHARHHKFIDKYVDSSLSFVKKLKKRIIPVSDDFLIRKLNANDLDYAYLEKFHVINFRVNSRKHYNRGRPLFHIMEVCPIPFQTVYIVPYGSPYLGILDILVRRAQEHGFVDHWAKLMDTQFKNTGKSIVRNNQNEEDLVVLRFNHLQAAFYMLSLGLILATIVLFVEIYQAYGIGLFIYQRSKWNEKHLRMSGHCSTKMEHAKGTCKHKNKKTTSTKIQIKNTNSS
ncbi:uncharacterized protein LOC129943069 [Eupeodes corollae]|uniref:uncharacterized protein LOC129943069 n=1 Tax=Eupeodes corollae TaxID=290404 RepID=UPI002490A6E5|nr:uncharacterized protein LOC129943069 [Eupeodes corollae]